MPAPGPEPVISLPTSLPLNPPWRRLGADVHSLCLLAALALALFAGLGHPKAVAQWRGLDILSEGGSALVAAWWSLVVRGARPAGRVTTALAGGLVLLALGNWVDCLDEFFKLPPSAWWAHGLESALGLAGTLALTAGLLLWRQEQHWVTAQLRQRERLFRDHRAFDRVTQLADAGYLRRQLQLEQQAGGPCGLLMLELQDDAALVRRLGADEHERLLGMLAQLLLLSLRREDLLCRYGGARFAVLLPHTDAATVQALGAQWAALVQAWRYPLAQGPALALSVRWAGDALRPEAGERDAVQALLDRLNRRLAAA